MTEIRNEDAIERLRHSAAHVMAQAVQALYPGAKFGVGPTIKDGFYYDIELDQPLTEEDLPRIEEKMRGIIGAQQEFKRTVMERSAAIDFFRKIGQDYKCEIIAGIPAGETISLYQNGDFIDLCRGPHVANTREIRAFKLLSVAGAYWRGDEKNKMLTRIYGTAFQTPNELDRYLVRLEEAKKRDHRKLGRELDLYSIQEDLGPGLVLWHPKGARLRKTIEDYWKAEHEAEGYDYVYSPHVARGHLWETSGHTSFYKDAMFSQMKVEEQFYQIKPMNCPFHILIYKTQTRSYRDLPIRMAELGTVYRYERSGTMHGLFRVRGFTQDDAHIFCTPEQLREEIQKVLELAFRVLRTFGFENYEIDLSVRDPRQRDKYAGSDEEWQQAEATLSECLEAKGCRFKRAEAEAVFYGPKIDIKILDAIERAWQCTTIQFDFNLPRRFDLKYVDRSGKEQYPFMVHRAIFGSLERFIGILTEHYGGAFPLWLAPVQAVIATITDRSHEAALQAAHALKSSGFRIETDLRAEKIGYKIREAELQKVPYILVIGDKEAASGSLAVRARGRKDLGVQTIDEVRKLFLSETQSSVKD
ncbi:MAG: threonine--tRNA ligase [Candidatus Omnitrophota bacterium]